MNIYEEFLRIYGEKKELWFNDLKAMHDHEVEKISLSPVIDTFAQFPMISPLGMVFCSRMKHSNPNETECLCKGQCYEEFVSQAIVAKAREYEKEEDLIPEIERELITRVKNGALANGDETIKTSNLVFVPQGFDGKLSQPVTDDVEILETWALENEALYVYRNKDNMFDNGYFFCPYKKGVLENGKHFYRYGISDNTYGSYRYYSYEKLFDMKLEDSKFYNPDTTLDFEL